MTVVTTDQVVETWPIGAETVTEAAPDEMWMTMDVAKEPDFSSVTPDGVGLVAVNSELGVHVVRLTPGRAVQEED